MNMNRISIAVCILIISTAVFGQAEIFQNLSSDIEYSEVFKPGGWAKYVLTDKKDRATDYKMSILEGGSEETPYVFEFKVIDKNGKWVITQFKAEDPMDGDSWGDMIVQSQGEQAVQMNLPKFKSQDFGVGSEGEDNDDFEFKSEENVEITVPAGTFTTTMVTTIDKSKRKERKSKFYYNMDVPMSIIKVENSDVSTMELVEYGDGAESEITGEVQKIEIPGLKDIFGK